MSLSTPTNSLAGSRRSPLTILRQATPKQRLKILRSMSQAELATIQKLHQEEVPNLRDFARWYCAIEPSPLVAAIMDASEGLRPEIDDETCERHFGCKADWLPKTPPRTVVVRAGGRGGKTSRLLAPKAIHAAWTVPLPTLGKGEEAVALLIAPDLDLARQALSFCKGYIEDSPTLSAAVVGKPNKNEIRLHRPDGKICKIAVRAASRGGKGGRAKTLVFAGLDEACFFRDESTGIVNDSEIYRAVLQRIVPGGQCWIVSTPWVEGIGLLEELLAKNFAANDNALCCVAPTRALNPTWDPTGEIERDLRESDPDAADREIEAIPLTAGSQQFFSPEAIKASVCDDLPQKLPKRDGASYGAGGDMAFRRNSSALVVVERDGEIYRVACVEERRPKPGLPLKPAGVADEFAPVIKEYGCESMSVDSHEREQVSLELARHQLSAVNAPEKIESYILARKLFHEGKVVMPNHPRLIRQLRDVMRKPQPGGGLTITSPRKSDGSHGDLVSALVNALWQASLSEPYESVRIPSRR